MVGSLSLAVAVAPNQVVSLAPRYVIVNAMDRAVEVQQAGLDGDEEPLKVAEDSLPCLSSITIDSYLSA